LVPAKLIEVLGGSRPGAGSPRSCWGWWRGCPGRTASRGCWAGSGGFSAGASSAIQGSP